MAASLKQIGDQARALSAEERAKLADSTLESLHSSLADIEAAWAQEIEQRVAAFDRGEIPTYPPQKMFSLKLDASPGEAHGLSHRLDANYFQRSPTTTARSLGLELASPQLLQKAAARALAGSPASKSSRRVFVKDFPFAVVYRPDAHGIVIFAAAHHRRLPEYWLSRVQDREQIVRADVRNARDSTMALGRRMTITIRHVDRSDAASWLSLRHALWPDAAEADHSADIEQFFAGAAPEPQAVMVAAEKTGKLVGFAELSIRTYAEGCNTDQVAFLEGWYVAPEFRRRGIARALVEAAEQWAIRKGHTRSAALRKWS